MKLSRDKLFYIFIILAVLSMFLTVIDNSLIFIGVTLATIALMIAVYSAILEKLKN